MLLEKAAGRRSIPCRRGESKDIVEELLKKAESAAERPRRERAELLEEASRLVGVPCGEILRPSRIRAAARARAVYCWLCREQAGVTGPELMAELKMNQSGISKLIGKGRLLLAEKN